MTGEVIAAPARAVDAGAVDAGSAALSPAALSPAALSSVALSPAAPASAADPAPRLRGEFFPLTVAEVSPLCADAAAVTFDVPAGLADRYAFRAGQSLTLRRRVDGRDERRSYSICAPEGARPRIGVREVPGGLFSTWLVREVRPGDRVEVSPPAGAFTPAQPAPGHHVMIAAGSGITPVLSITATLLRDDAATVTLLYGNRHADTVMFADDLADLKDRYPARLDLVHVLSREVREAELLTGRLDPAKLTSLLPLLADPAGVAHWWLCGPLDMITGAQQVLRGLGVPAGRVHRELFYAGDVPPPPARHDEAVASGVTTEATIILDGRSTRLVLPRDTPVLEAAQRARPDLPFACKGGVCGTCRARVTFGEVRMRRNYALEEAEVADGYALTCQSLPVSAAVTIDYDA